MAKIYLPDGSAPEYPNGYTFNETQAWDLLCLSEAIENVTTHAKEGEYPFINQWRSNNGSMEIRTYLISIGHIPHELVERCFVDGYDGLNESFDCFDFGFVPWFVELLEKQKLFGEPITADQLIPFVEQEVLRLKLENKLQKKCHGVKNLLKTKTTSETSEDLETAMLDLIADFKIYADREGWNFKSIVKGAKYHAKADQDITDQDTIIGLA